MNLTKGENALMGIGLTLAVPVNFNILFTNVESDFLNSIRQFQKFEMKYVSDSLVRITTQHNKKKIKVAKDSLAAMGIIKIHEVSPLGTRYEILYKELCAIIKKLNAETNPWKRLIIADEFRGQDRAIHSKLIEEYGNTKFSNII